MSEQVDGIIEQFKNLFATLGSQKKEMRALSARLHRLVLKLYTGEPLQGEIVVLKSMLSPFVDKEFLENCDRMFISLRDNKELAHQFKDSDEGKDLLQEADNFCSITSDNHKYLPTKLRSQPYTHRETGRRPIKNMTFFKEAEIHDTLDDYNRDLIKGLFATAREKESQAWVSGGFSKDLLSVLEVYKKIELLYGALVNKSPEDIPIFEECLAFYLKFAQVGRDKLLAQAIEAKRQENDEQRIPKLQHVVKQLNFLLAFIERINLPEHVDLMLKLKSDLAVNNHSLAQLLHQKYRNNNENTNYLDQALAAITESVAYNSKNVDSLYLKSLILFDQAHESLNKKNYSEALLSLDKAGKLARKGLDKTLMEEGKYNRLLGCINTSKAHCYLLLAFNTNDPVLAFEKYMDVFEALDQAKDYIDTLEDSEKLEASRKILNNQCFKHIMSLITHASLPTLQKFSEQFQKLPFKMDLIKKELTKAIEKAEALELETNSRLSFG